MNRGRGFFIGVAAALVTFGALTVAFGPRHNLWSHGYGYHTNHRNMNCHLNGDDQRGKETDSTESGSSDNNTF
jgi:hypothetical protein